MSETVLLIGYRVDDLETPFVESQKEECRNCEHDIWVAEEQIMELPHEPDAYECIQCAKQRKRRKRNSDVGVAG